MKRWAWFIVVAQVGLVGGLAIALRPGRMPLGVRGEWEWLRIDRAPDPLPVFFALGAVAIYAIYAVAGARGLVRPGAKSGWWLIGLVPLGVFVQAMVQEGAPDGYGLVKWAIVLPNSGSSGYYTVAKTQMPDLRSFLANYPVWIGRQDPLHVGTHPPGLFVINWAMLRMMEAHPAVAKLVNASLPRSLDLGFRAIGSARPLPPADRASITLIGLSILIACSAVVVPIYWLARSRLSASAAWGSAVLWPLVPSTLMFQPTADAAFPLLSAAALAFAAWAGTRPSLALLAGIVLAVGTQLTLAFFPVGLVAAVVYLTESGASWKRRLGLIGLTGVGFVGLTAGLWAMTGANPLTIWWHNSVNHGRFYVHYPRSYWRWVVENPLELAVGLGLPTVCWIAVGPTRWPRVAWATVGVLALLTLSGKNLSEVARLWIPLMPGLLVAAGAGMERLGASPVALATTLGLLGIQTLVLEATIQVVYPI